MKKLLITAILTFLILFPVISYGAEGFVNWQPNSEPDLAGYKIYYGTQSGNYLPPIDVGNVITYTIMGLSEGVMYYLVLTAYDTSGNESGYSAEAAAMKADTTSPGAPSQFSFTIQ